jgi:hypothetical protein
MMGIVGELWSRQPDGNITDAEIRQMVDEVAALISDDTISFRVIAPLVNFKMEEGLDRIVFQNGLAIIKLSDEEVTRLRGGPYPYMRGWEVTLPECAISTVLTERKIVGMNETADDTALTDLQGRLDRLVMALRTIRNSPVGYREAMLLPTRFVPMGYVTRTFMHEYVPLGSYHLTAAEVPAFRVHAEHLIGDIHQSLEIACSRLADAAIRLKHRDRLIDAVIGLEAVLLKNSDDLKYRGEVRYRFAMNYASLFGSADEKERQFRVARDVYDLRSNIAHGGEVRSDKAKIGSEVLSLGDAAMKACEMLRDLIQRFAASAHYPGYLREGFWRQQLFADGTADEAATDGTSC